MRRTRQLRTLVKRGPIKLLRMLESEVGIGRQQWLARRRCRLKTTIFLAAHSQGVAVPTPAQSFLSASAESQAAYVRLGTSVRPTPA
jgi:hypothetical protein